MYELCDRLLPVFTGKTVLDVGGGAGGYAKKALDAGALSAVVVDNRQYRAYPQADPQELPKGVEHHWQDVFTWTSPVDVVLCFNVLYYVENPYGFMRHLRGLTKETCCLVCWFVPGEGAAWMLQAPREAHPTDPTVFWLPTIAGLRKMAEVTGFTIEVAEALGDRYGMRLH